LLVDTVDPVLVLVAVNVGLPVVALGVTPVNKRFKVFVFFEVNHVFPSIPATIPDGPLLAPGRTNSETLPLLVIRPIRFVSDSVNQS